MLQRHSELEKSDSAAAEQEPFCCVCVVSQERAPKTQSKNLEAMYTEN